MTKEQVLQELQEIAKEIGLNWKNSEVLLEYNKRHPEGISVEICKALIHPVYFPKEQCTCMPECADEWADEKDTHWYD